ncbi:fused MFS/spermidine synthase [Candidatus Micrarchaeota archaeon]|nr:fused MFS/spermidine synthase [Patescibacteria group bacterium]MBU1930419.1 fused MFS/spermidine synthase [Candidatus Micrarchaeota archaeon]
MKEIKSFKKQHFTKFLIFAMALSGMAALIYEVVANEVLFFFFDSSSHSLATVLSSFLLGLAIGSFLISKTLHRIKNKRRAFVVIQVLIGVYAILFLTNFEIIPQYLSVFYNWAGENAALFLLSKFIIANTYFIFPTILLGASFPLAVSIIVKRAKRAGADVGTLYSADLAGAIIGSIIGGFILIPLLGLKAAILAGAAMNFLSAIFTVEKRRSISTYLFIVLIAGLLIFSFIGIVTPENKSAFYFQTVTQTEDTNSEELTQNSTDLQESNSEQQAPSINEFFEKKNVLFQADSPFGQVHVTEVKGCKELYLDRRFQCACWSESEREFPKILLEGSTEKINALVIGLGCGITASTVAESENVKKTTIIEINPFVVQASEYFREDNNNVIDNEKIELVVADAGRYLLETDKIFDTIIMDVENPQIAHSSSLYTVEYFKIMKNRLDDNGALAIWSYRGQYDYTKTFYRSLKEAFPTVYVKFGYNDSFKLFYAFKKETQIPLTSKELELNQMLEKDKQFELNTLNNQVLKNKIEG